MHDSRDDANDMGGYLVIIYIYCEKCHHSVQTISDGDDLRCMQCGKRIYIEIKSGEKT
jgi:DNA-directed RNA polymerase subunit RPC12/RpoP